MYKGNRFHENILVCTFKFNVRKQTILKNVFERKVLLSEIFDKQQTPYRFNRPPQLNASQMGHPSAIPLMFIEFIDNPTTN